MNKAAQLKTIDHAFNALPQIFHQYDTIGEKLYKMNLEAERQHRKGFGRTAPRGFSANAAARLFTVLHLAQALEMPNRYKVTDVLHIRLECLFAQAYAAEHRAAILDAWNAAKVDPAAIMAIDYAELMKD
jgi:hypothetical protein